VTNIGQDEHFIVFHETGIVQGDYSRGREGMSGKYQHTDDLDELMATWKPEDMLPRAYKDLRMPAPVIEGLAAGMK
jgi:hypothetical protein